MRSCQSSKSCKSLPKIWLLSDPRFGRRLLPSIQKLPWGSGVIFRHYDHPKRQEIYRHIVNICRKRGHKLVIAGDERLASSWKADGFYQGQPGSILPKQSRFMNIIGVHNIKELYQAKRLRADVILLSPVYTTLSHKGKRPLGIMAFQHLALLSRKRGITVLALGGMDKKRAAMIPYIYGYAAIDGLIG